MPELLVSISRKVDEISAKQCKIEKELQTNGGSTLRDELKLLVSERLMEIQEAPYPAFRCTTEGKNIFVNRAYEALIGVPEEELMSLGWKSFLADIIEGEAYFAKWQELSETKSFYSGKITLKDKDDNPRGVWLVRIVPLGPHTTHDHVWGGKMYPADSRAHAIADEHGWRRSH